MLSCYHCTHILSMAQLASCIRAMRGCRVSSLASLVTTPLSATMAAPCSAVGQPASPPLSLQTPWAQPGPLCMQYRHSSIISVEEHENACWNCQHHMKRGSFACQGCEKIQPVDPTLNYFELLAMPNMQFDIDMERLDKQYKLLQWSLHPDKVVLRPVEEQEHAAQQATLINHAYSILRQPLSRANYILSLRGVQNNENFEGTIDDEELLMEVLEAREQVESTDDEGELREMLKTTHQHERDLVKKISGLFKQRAYVEAVPIVTHLTYLVKLEHEIVSKLPYH